MATRIERVEEVVRKEGDIGGETGTAAPSKPGKLPGVEGTGDFDFKLWEDMPVSGKNRLTADGLRIMSIRDTGQIVLRPDASLLSAAHESYPAKHFGQLGKEKYMKLFTLEKEEYVYNEIIKNKDKFTTEEIYEAQRYMFKLRNGQWPPPNWKGFEE